MKEEIEALRKELANITESFNQRINSLEKTTLEVGKWYRYEHPGVWGFIGLITEITDRLIHYKGFELYTGNTRNSNFNYDCPVYMGIRPATEEEIKSALVKEAERKKYQSGCTIKECISTRYGKGITVVASWAVKGAEYHLEYDELWCGGVCIYCRGKWAEIIKQDTIKIGDEEVHYYDKKNAPNSHIKIKTISYSKAELIDLKEMMSRGQIKSLNVDCSGQYKVDLELLSSILEGFDK